MNIFFEILKQGLGYLKIWPQQKVLNCLFIDSKVTFYTRFFDANNACFHIVKYCF